MKVAVLCEYSGTVRDAFQRSGHYAISCDIIPTESELSKPYHVQGDLRDYRSLWEGMDLVIAHPECRYLSNVGNRWISEERKKLRLQAFEFVMWINSLKVKRLCIENPKGYLNTHWRKPDQIIQPYYWGDSEMKTTCLWLRGLPPLQHYKEDDLFFKRTHIDRPEPKRLSTGEKTKGQKIYFVESHPGGKNGSKVRSKTFPGIAQAMTNQWGIL